MPAMTLRRATALLIVLVLAAAAFVVAKIGPSNVIGMLRYDTRREGALRVGSVAPDVTLHVVDGAGTVRIAQRIGARPLVLVFGSFT
jgi:hypothetical protein